MEDLIKLFIFCLLEDCVPLSEENAYLGDPCPLGVRDSKVIPETNPGGTETLGK